ncbi:MAG: flagellar assembly protein FliW [Peptococcia bacterium]
MLYNTLRFGEVEVKEEQIITFPWGLPGFIEQKKYLPIQYQEDGSLAFLQSLDMPELAFIIADPFKYVVNYEVNIPEDELNNLQITKDEEVLVYTILTVQPGGSEITANLMAPVVINTKKRIGKQIILLNSSYDSRYPLTSGQAAAK